MDLAKTEKDIEESISLMGDDKVQNQEKMRSPSSATGARHVLSRAVLIKLVVDRCCYYSVYE